jgi:hypothetical protein
MATSSGCFRTDEWRPLAHQRRPGRVVQICKRGQNAGPVPAIEGDVADHAIGERQPQPPPEPRLAGRSVLAGYNNFLFG